MSIQPSAGDLRWFPVPLLHGSKEHILPKEITSLAKRQNFHVCSMEKTKKLKKHVCFLTLRFLIPSWFLIEIWIKGDEEFCLNILEGLSSCKNSNESSDFAHHAFVEVGSKIKGPRFSSQWYPTSESPMTWGSLANSMKGHPRQTDPSSYARNIEFIR